MSTISVWSQTDHNWSKKKRFRPVFYLMRWKDQGLRSQQDRSGLVQFICPMQSLGPDLGALVTRVDCTGSTAWIQKWGQSRRLTTDQTDHWHDRSKSESQAYGKLLRASQEHLNLGYFSQPNPLMEWLTQLLRLEALQIQKWDDLRSQESSILRLTVFTLRL